MLLALKIWLQMSSPIQWVCFCRYFFLHNIEKQTLMIMKSIPISTCKNNCIDLNCRKQILFGIILRILTRYQSPACSGLVKYGVNMFPNLRYVLISSIVIVNFGLLVSQGSDLEHLLNKISFSGFKIRRKFRQGSRMLEWHGHKCSHPCRGVSEIYVWFTKSLHIPFLCHPSSKQW